MDGDRHSNHLAKRARCERFARWPGAGHRRPRGYAQLDRLRLGAVRSGHGFVVANGRVKWRPHQPCGNVARQWRCAGDGRRDQWNRLHRKGGSVRWFSEKLERDRGFVLLARGSLWSFARQRKGACRRRLQRVLRFCRQLGALQSGERNLAIDRRLEHRARGGCGGFGGQSFLQSAELYDPATGGWTITGSMHDARWEAAGILLPNGKVLVAGGSTNTSLVGMRSAELYDPTNQSWSVTGSMTDARCAFTMTLLSNGKVLAAGGFGTNGALITAELYDPATGAWTPTGSLETPRGSHTATLLSNGKVLVAGGTDFFTVASTVPIDPTRSSAEIYDPATETWTPTASMGQPRQTHTATLLPNGKVLVAGGVSYFGGVFPTSADLYNPVTGKWSPTFPL